MRETMIGNAWKFGDNIDTDVITTYKLLLGVPGEEEYQMLRKNAFQALRKDFYKQVKPGDILIAGENFGFGSHREQANIVLPLLGFQAIISESFARIYFRNSIAIGFPAYEVPGITAIVDEGDQLEIDSVNNIITNKTNGKVCSIEPHSEMVGKILDAGNIFNFMRDRLEREFAANRGSQ